uniref:Uncharacterized protein n=1 Tax=Romanomermis culicivorax TaxID=13658 RepID=A0A915KM32_ROMCU
MNKRLAGQCDDLLNDLKIFIPQKKFVDFKTTECVNFGKYQILCLAERYCHLEIDKNLVITNVAHQIKTKVQARINVRTSDALIHLQLNMDDYKTINLDGAYQKWFGNSQQGPYNIGQQRKMVQNKNETDDDAYHFEDF